MRALWALLLVLAAGCDVVGDSGDPTSLPSRSVTPDTLVGPLPAIPSAPGPSNAPFAAPPDRSWPETGPIGYRFSLNTQWGQALPDTTAFRYGWRSEKFVVAAGECFGSDCSRTPVFERKEYGEGHDGLATEGDEYWYGWSFYVPYESTNNWAFFGQFIQPPADSSVGHDSIWMLLKRARAPFCMVFDWVTFGSTAFTHCGSPNIELLSDAEFAGRWHDLVFHMIWSHDYRIGLTQVWVDGVLKGERRGNTLTPKHLGIAVKYGIYRIADPKTTIVYYDEMRKGKTRQAVDIRMLIPP